MAAAQSAVAARVVLNADDFAISAGVTAGIARLAEQGLLSATSAIVTLPRWGEDAPRLAALRARIAVGLHLNLTLGNPLGAMPKLCPGGGFPELRRLVTLALAGRIDADEIAAETGRQLAAFERATGHPPDHIEGHQHVHALPAVRRGVLAALERADPDRTIIVRDPADRWSAIRARGVAVRKAVTVALLARGFGAEARRLGFVTNQSFAGFSEFAAASAYGDELARCCGNASARHIVMCHPGYPDAELARLDAITDRRRQELEAIEAAGWLKARLAVPERGPAGRPVFWSGMDQQT